jgi:hypothetical protein
LLHWRWCRRTDDGELVLPVSADAPPIPDAHFKLGRPTQRWLYCDPAGADDSDTAARDSAVVASIALQYGVPLDVLRHALMRDAQGRPSGPLGTALDLIAKRQERA